MILDEKNRRILEILQEDAKSTIKEMALALGLSATAVHERVKKLEREEVIKKYVAVVDREKVDRELMVFCQVRLARHVKETVLKFEREIFKLQEVLECIHVSGDYDYLLKVYVKDRKAYRAFIINKLTAIPGIGSTQSNFMIGEIKNDTAIKFS